MKTAATLIQTAALAACFVAHMAHAPEFAGVRRALQTMAGAPAAHTLVAHPAPAEAAALA